MPELPEVETIVRGLHSQLEERKITQISFFRADLRTKIPQTEIKEVLIDNPVLEVHRRSKYILIRTKRGTVLVHLGMTGKVLNLKKATPHYPHTHWIFKVERENKKPSYMHYVDPRRFGQISSWLGDEWEKHHFIKHLGVEPLEQKRLGTYLWEKSRKKKQPIKNYLMDHKIMVGVGNIYACESLFKAGISPKRLASQVSVLKYEKLARAICQTLRRAIKAGGTTLQDFQNVNESPGYFSISLKVYGRQKEPCKACQKPIQQIKQAGRSTWYCSGCQK